MRTPMLMLLLAIGLGLAAGPAVLAGPSSGIVGEAGIVEGRVEPVQFWTGSRCERLRRACINKEERGEVGEGNCRRFREECLDEGRGYCERLRRACANKEERGEVGEGNCRRYRRECGDR